MVTEQLLSGPNPRASKNKVYHQVLTSYANLATCPRLHNAALVLTEAGRVLSIGYNGSPRGFPHCDGSDSFKTGEPLVAVYEDGSADDDRAVDFSPHMITARQKRIIKGYRPRCTIVDGHCVTSVHAEANALMQAAKAGIAVEGSRIYTLYRPCIRCTGMIIQAGAKTVCYFHDYDTDRAKEVVFAMLNAADVDHCQLPVPGMSAE